MAEDLGNGVEDVEGFGGNFGPMPSPGRAVILRSKGSSLG